MASSSSPPPPRTWKYDVFPSFSGEDVRKSFLSHFLEKLQGKSIITFIDNRIERSRTIELELELLLAIRQSRISIVVFSKKYASSTWCLNELAEIHDSHEESDQTVIPIFYEVDPSHVRKQIGEFGNAFETTCEGKSEDRIERWKKALSTVASLAGYDSQNWLKHRKVLIVLDDVDEIEFLETLVGQTGWFGFGSRIIVVTQDKALLEKHGIDLIYKVELPSEDLALQMFCQSAFGKTSPPDGFMELAVEVAKLAGNLPLGLTVLGSSLRGKLTEHWVDMMPMLRNGLNGKIERTLRISYEGLDEKDYQDIFVYIACLFNGESVNYIKNLLEKSFRSVHTSLTTLADKSLLRIITPHKTVQMHILLEKLGREIVRAESIDNPGKRRFLVDAEEISDVFNDNSGTENVLGIHFDTSEIYDPLSIDEKSFEGMRNLQFIKFYKERWRYTFGDVGLYLPRGLLYLPRKLRLLHWDVYPAKYIPSSFSAEYLVELKMVDSKLEKLWEGAQPCRNLKVINLSGSRDLKEIPDLSNATSLDSLILTDCTSLVALPSSIRNLNKLRDLCMERCTKLEVLPTDINLESLDYLDLRGCSSLKRFPRISRNISRLELDGTAMDEEDCLWIENLLGLVELHWTNCPLRCMPSNFHPEHLVQLQMRGSKLEKLWDGVKSLTNLTVMYLKSSENLKEIPDLSKATSLSLLILSGCKNLKEIPDLSNAIRLRNMNLSGCKSLEKITGLSKATNLADLNLSECENLEEIPNLSKATNLEILILDNCTSLVKLPSSFQHHEKLRTLNMSGCTSLKVLPTNINLVSLPYLNLSGCSRLTSFPQISTSIKKLNLDDTAIEEFPSWIENIAGLTELSMSGCTNLEGLPTNINLVSLTTLNLSGCSRLRTFPQLSTSIENLYLSDTAIEEVPSWIKNIAKLTHLEMRRCEKLKTLSANIWNLGCCLESVDFTDCGGVTSVSDASLVKTVAELHEEMYLFCSDSDTELQLFHYFNSDTRFLFHSCFNLDQDAQKFILQSDFGYAILPGKKVPTYFTHRTRGSCLTVPLPQSSLSQNHLGFTACMIIDVNECPKNIIVHSKFRGVTGMCNIYPNKSSSLMDHHHLLVFHFDFCPEEEVNDPPSPLDSNSVKFEFELHKDLHNSLIFPSKVIECGVRVLNVSSSLNGNDRSSETEYTHQSRESDVNTERSKKRMRKTVVTSQEPSNALSGQTAMNQGSMALNLELALGLGEAHPHVSPRSKVYSPLTSSRNFHGNGDGLSLNLSSPPFDLRLEEEAVYCDPMITEQQHTGTPSEEATSSSPQLIHFFR